MIVLILLKCSSSLEAHDQLFLLISFYFLSFFSILLFPFKWQNKKKPLISTQKNMSIWEMMTNKTPSELFAFEAPFMSTFPLSASVTPALSPNFVVKAQSALALGSVDIYTLVCVFACRHMYTRQPLLVIRLSEPAAHGGYLFG